MSSIHIQIDGLIPANRRLNALKLKGVKKRRELTKLCRKVISFSKKRVQGQSDLAGSAYKKRHKPRSDRRKMLTRLYRMLKVMRNDGTDAIVSFPGFAANIAAKQQYGFTETVTAAKLKQQQGGGTSNKNFPATKQQAKALRDLGYKIGGRKASLSQITATLKSGKAGAMIRAMRKARGLPSHSSWNTVLAPRSALGATDSEVSTLVNILINDITEEF
jgi:hypothetical protein